MSVARNSMNVFPYYTYKEVHGFGNNFGGFRLWGAAASPTVAIVVGMNTSETGQTFSTAGSVIKTSTDGIVWSNVATTSFGNNAVTNIAYGNDTFVAVGGGNTIATSPGTSGTTWTQRTSPATGTNAWGTLTFQNNIFIAVNTATRAYYSSDGITWSSGAQIATTGLTATTSATDPSGGIFYIANNPTSAKWLHAYGQLYSVSSQTHFYVYQDITSSGTISQSYSTDQSGSRGPQWIPEDNKLLVSVGSHTTPNYNGHASALYASNPVSPTEGGVLPDAILPAGVFFPSVIKGVGQLSIGQTSASSVLSQFGSINAIVAGGGSVNTRKARYIYNDGYYNCLYVGNGILPENASYGGVYYQPTVNVAFSADNHSYAESIQIIGSGLVPQGGNSTQGSNLGARQGGFEMAIDIKFKGNSYIFFKFYNSSLSRAHGYLVGKRSIRPLRTTIGLGA